MEKRVNLRRLREILPADGSQMSLEDVAAACGVKRGSVAQAVERAIREAAGVTVVRNARRFALGVRRLDVSNEYAEPMRPDLAAIPGRDPATPAPVIPLRPRPAAPESDAPAEAPAEEFAETF